MLEKAVAHQKSQAGFSLIELVVVILIVGILATVMIPRFIGQRDSSNDASAQASLRNAATQLQSWYLQNGESYPASSDSSGLNALADFVCTSEPSLSVAGRCGALAGSTGGPPTAPASCSGSMCTPGSSADPSRVFLTTGPTAGKSNYATVCNVSRGSLQQCVRLSGASATAWSNSSSGLSVASAIGSNGQNYRAAVMKTSGLLAYWPLDESSGSTATDLKGGFDLTVSGSPTLGQGALITPGGAAVSFPGGSTAAQLSRPWHQTLAASTTSFEAWFRLTSQLTNADTRYLMRFNCISCTPGNTGYNIILTGNAAGTQNYVNTTLGSGGTSSYPAPAAVSTNQVYHLVLTLSGTQSLLYLNGSLAVTGTLPASFVPNANTQAFQIGGCAGCGAVTTFPGVIDEAAVYSTALDAATVKAHYDAGK